MLYAELVDVLQQYAVPIGIGLAALLFLLVPPLRKGLIKSFEEGRKDGERWRGKKREEEEERPDSR
jgi:hypothetical protein